MEPTRRQGVVGFLIVQEEPTTCRDGDVIRVSKSLHSKRTSD